MYSSNQSKLSCCRTVANLLSHFSQFHNTDLSLPTTGGSDVAELGNYEIDSLN